MAHTRTHAPTSPEALVSELVARIGNAVPGYRLEPRPYRAAVERVARILQLPNMSPQKFLTVHRYCMTGCPMHRIRHIAHDVTRFLAEWSECASSYAASEDAGEHARRAEALAYMNGEGMDDDDLRASVLDLLDREEWSIGRVLNNARGGNKARSWLRQGGPEYRPDFRAEVDAVRQKVEQRKRALIDESSKRPKGWLVAALDKAIAHERATNPRTKYEPPRPEPDPEHEERMRQALAQIQAMPKANLRPRNGKDHA